MNTFADEVARLEQQISAKLARGAPSRPAAPSRRVVCAARSGDPVEDAIEQVLHLVPAGAAPSRVFRAADAVARSQGLDAGRIGATAIAKHGMRSRR